MDTALTLDRLRVGERALVTEVTTSGAMRRRLYDLGLAAGTELECVGKSPAGDPAAYLIRGAVIAIRAEDGRKIAVNAAGRTEWD